MLVCNACDLNALTGIGGSGLFENEVVILAESGDSVAEVLLVHGADEHYVSKTGLLQHLLCAVETALCGNAVLVSESLKLTGNDVCAGNDLDLVLKELAGVCVGITS
jgi:hypothetical protein